MNNLPYNRTLVNTPKHDFSVAEPGKVQRIVSEKLEDLDYHKAKNLSSWLFMKHCMSYRSFRKKSAARREKLRVEYTTDTGNRPDSGR